MSNIKNNVYNRYEDYFTTHLNSDYFFDFNLKNLKDVFGHLKERVNDFEVIVDVKKAIKSNLIKNNRIALYSGQKLGF